MEKKIQKGFAKTISKINKYQKSEERESNWSKMISCTDKLIKYLKSSSSKELDEKNK